MSILYICIKVCLLPIMLSSSYSQDVEQISHSSKGNHPFSILYSNAQSPRALYKKGHFVSALINFCLYALSTLRFFNYLGIKKP